MWQWDSYCIYCLQHCGVCGFMAHLCISVYLLVSSSICTPQHRAGRPKLRGKKNKAEESVVMHTCVYSHVPIMKLRKY